MMVFSPTRPLDAEMVRGIESLDGVQTTNLFSMGQVSIENTALNIVAVDPARYRLFTDQHSADLQERGTGSPKVRSRSSNSSKERSHWTSTISSASGPARTTRLSTSGPTHPR